ncbi:hypothetical protein EB118_15565 [bacterium]|nr:hypothetical protein [bacterium]
MSNFETPKMPEVKFNKNGYEIRTEILGMAKQMAEFEYSAKFQGWEMSTARDEKTGQFVTTVGMPQVPGLEQILQTAQKMYDFVNQGNNKR